MYLAKAMPFSTLHLLQKSPNRIYPLIPLITVFHLKDLEILSDVACISDLKVRT